MVFDMPNNLPPCITRERLLEKKALIEKQLQEAQIGLRYELYLGADKNHFQEIHRVKNEVVGVKVFMGSSTGDLLMDDESSLHAVFAIAAQCDIVVAIHAEDEEMIRARTLQYAHQTAYAIHSLIRTPEVAAAAVKKVIELVSLYGTRAYILHVSSIPELELIQQAKKQGLPVYAETSPHHLFLNTDAYEDLQGRAKMNPPLRSKEHQAALVQAIHEGVIDTIGSDHAPHMLDEKARPYGQCPSGVPGVETNLPLLLNAHHQGIFSLEEIVRLTSFNARRLFSIPDHHDWVLVDLSLTKTVSPTMLKTKCGWSPFDGQILTGWPVFSVIKGRLYDLQ